MTNREETFWIVLREVKENGPLEFVERSYSRWSGEQIAERHAREQPGTRFFAAKVKVEARMPKTPEVSVRVLDKPIPF